MEKSSDENGKGSGVDRANGVPKKSKHVSRTIMSERKDFDWLPLAAVKAWDKNPRRNAKAVEPVARSIVRFGFVAPVVYWPGGGRMVAGHTRIKALEAILLRGYTGMDGSRVAARPDYVPPGAPGPGLVPVRFQEFATEIEADAYALADNKLAQISEWDEKLLAEAQQAIAAVDADLLKIAGWTEDELAALQECGEAGEDPAPKVSLADRFGVAPFTVLNAREGWWQNRKRAWLSLGIRSELGRGEQLIPSGGGMTSKHRYEAQP